MIEHISIPLEGVPRFEFWNCTGKSIWFRYYTPSNSYVGHTLPQDHKFIVLEEDVVIDSIQGLVWQHGDPEVWQPTFNFHIPQEINSCGGRITLVDFFGIRPSYTIKSLILCLASPADPRTRNDIALYEMFRGMNVPYENTLMLLEQQATVAAALASLEALVASTTADDCVLFYWGSHGSVQDQEYYSKLFDGYLTASQVLSVLRNSPSGKVLTVVDACHSGQVLEQAPLFFPDDSKREESRFVFVSSTQAWNSARSGWRTVTCLLDALNTAEIRSSPIRVANYICDHLVTPLEGQKAQMALF